MYRTKIPKGGGRYRTIYVPSPDEKMSLAALLPEIEQAALEACPDNVPHGFLPGRSPVTNAQQHIGFAFTYCLDLEDFFDTVQESHLRGKLRDEVLQRILVDGAPRQGLPTSPAAANLAAAELDHAIIDWLESDLGSNGQFSYTRYADDLTISFDEPSVIPTVPTRVEQLVNAQGFSLSRRKTRLYKAKAGRRIITGVGVDDTRIYPTRRAKRRLRAAKHRHGLSPGNWLYRQRARGLAEWVACKPPNTQPNPPSPSDKEGTSPSPDRAEAKNTTCVW